MDIIEHKQLLDKEGIIYSFNGTVCQNILIGLGQVIEDIFNKETISQTDVLRIFSVYTEQMHNIMSYSSDKICMKNNRYESRGVSIIGYDKNKQKYFVGSANFIDKKDEDRLNSKLQKILGLDALGVKDYYRELRRSRKDSHSRGGGLGFLEMAKKSSEKLQYKIMTTEKNKIFFEIVVYI